jgi:uncharacterized protein
MDDGSAVLERSAVESRAEAIEDEIRKLGVTALFLFGSAARNDLRSASDIDVFIDYDQASPLSLFTLAHLQRLLSAGLGRRADVATRDGLHPMLRNDIEASSARVF